jgi:hypothetical protein
LKLRSQQIKDERKKKQEGESRIYDRIESFLKAFQAVWTQDKLADMSMRFSMLKKTLDLNILVSIRFVPANPFIAYQVLCKY